MQVPTENKEINVVQKLYDLYSKCVLEGVILSNRSVSCL